MKKWMVSWTIKLNKTECFGSGIVDADSESEARYQFLMKEHEKLELLHRAGVIKVFPYRE